MKNLSKIKYFIVDYFYGLCTISHGIFIKAPPDYLCYNKNNEPIILIPGLYNKWNSMRFLAKALAQTGHPVYFLTHIGRNTDSIASVSLKVKQFIDQNGLQDVVIVGHSKGGLIGKYLLDNLNQENRIKKVVAIASPFKGSQIANHLPFKEHAELRPQSPVIFELSRSNQNNHKITSIYGKFDNHVRPISSCILEGAKNIQVNCHGHHRLLYDKEVRDLVILEINQNYEQV